MSQDYKDTLNLPKTSFSMKASLSQREPQWLQQWEKQDLYHQLQAHCEDRPTFILHDGPPYANGAIHMGHAVNKILKDIIIKSKVLSGYKAPYVPGWDCHGLPIEIQIEKKVGKVGHKIEATAFRQKCREYAQKQVEIQKKDFQRMGVLGEWESPYLTKDFSYEADMVRALGTIIKKGHVIQGVKPVNWCFDCGSALAEAEIEYQDKQSPAIDVAFPFVDEDQVLSVFDSSAVGKPVALPIWTTTPWTIPANRAVSLHPELSYSLVRGHQDFDLVIATEMVAEVAQRYGFEPQEVAQVNGAALELLQLQHPLFDIQVPVILGEHVNTDAGTGAVHTAPGHGADDFAVAAKYDLEIYNPVGSNGVYLPDTPQFAGQHIWKANASVTEALKEQGKLLQHETIHHSYPHCWRHKTPTAFRTTPQWFVSMDKEGLRQGALQAIDDVQWIPDWGRDRIYGMIENRPEWCISRQRTWGVPITLFVDKQSGEMHPNTLPLIDEIAGMIEQKGIDAWFDLKPQDILPAEEADQYEKINDVLDVWFDSGVSHYCVLKQRPNLTEPADLYLEGSDQHRGWFHSSLLTGIAINDQAPYKQVLTHGFVVDQNGKKMSKSLGNVVSPIEIAKSMGADILRLWVSSADYRGEMTISKDILNRAADGYRRIRNTARFILGNTHDFNVEDALPISDCAEIDQWAINEMKHLQEAVIQHYADYQLHQVFQKVHHFCSQQMGAFYLDVIKDRLYTAASHSPARRSAQTAMHHILQSLTRLIAPILTFTADEIWQQMGSEKHVLFEQWYDFSDLETETKITQEQWQQIAEVRQSVSKSIEVLRKSGEIGASLEAAVTLYVDADLKNTLDLLGDELRFILITSAAQVLPLEAAPSDVVVESLSEAKMGVTVTLAEGEKCQRCWHIRTDVGGDAAHPNICGRCVENVQGVGEVRKVA